MYKEGILLLTLGVLMMGTAILLPKQPVELNGKEYTTLCILRDSITLQNKGSDATIYAINCEGELETWKATLNIGRSI